MMFRPFYLVVAAAIFVVEVAIAAGYIPGAFVRNSVGDMLVIALIYCLLRGVSKATCFVALVISVSAGFATEFLQYLHMADLMGLRKGSVASIVLGSTFSVSDLVMYVFGGCIAAWLDMLLLKLHTR